MRWIVITVMGLCIACNQPQQPVAFSFKEKLSDYGFFTGALKDLRPVAGILPYELATPLFTDYALKDRFIVLPKGKAIQYRDSGVLDFPDSTFIIKNFAYTDTAGRKVMIETRLLFRDPADHGWKVMNYLWNAEQTEAGRWITGKRIPITLLNDERRAVSTVYQMPNTNDCKRCHSSNGSLQPIGPKARNVHYNGQLEKWAAGGALQGKPAQVAAMPVWNDSRHYTLDQRARAYLDVNCAHCHTKGGDADNTGLFLEYEQQQPNHLGMLKQPVSAGNGAGGLDFDIVPGSAAKSILIHRMNSTEPGTAMPELARTLVHKEGLALITAWVNSLPPQQ
ncbi:hypothetical protein EGT74_17205 [Chitinophaga lutea]|uniref:Cytochrome c domain-containing protein n=1 Tax=Chitinophaga lutea TaxID=2488634 RepID=A0A3N4PYL6_9BACT|nr:SO2930 family diheme c-type cytochrome [Chitinophaga lutea]RPE08770.1 hypothetical protein EGT74_17205 [Chitinophaga lutea]